MSNAADIPDVIVNLVQAQLQTQLQDLGRMTGGARCGKLRVALLLAGVVLYVALVMLAKTIYLREQRLDRIALQAEDTGKMISRLHHLQQQLTADLDLLDDAHPLHFDH